MNLKEILNKFEGILLEKKPKILDLLNQGLSEQSFIDKMKFLDKQISTDILTLYQWKNGFNQDLTSNEVLFSDGYFIDLDCAIDLYKLSFSHYWNEFFFPIFSSGDVLILIGIVKGHISYNKVYVFDMSPGAYAVYKKSIVPYYDSLEKLFLSNIKCYEQGAYSFNELGELKVDWDLQWSICKEINTNSEYWQVD